MKKNLRKIIYSVEGMRNVYWDESPIDVGCEVSIPYKFDGNQPLCIISHGSGGLGNDTEHFVNALNDSGIATLCIDSFSCRNMTNINWNELGGYVSPRARAYETAQAFKFVVENHESLFANLDITKVACVGFSWGADSIAQVIAHYGDVLPKETFYALVYGNLWPFEPEFYNAKDCDVTLYHGTDDNWTSAERGKIFAKETNSEFVEFFDCSHGFCKPGYDDEVAEQVMINHHADFPVPTRLKDVFSWIQKGKIWKDTDMQRVDSKMSFDPMATQRIISDIVGKLTNA